MNNNDDLPFTQNNNNVSSIENKKYNKSLIKKCWCHCSILYSKFVEGKLDNLYRCKAEIHNCICELHDGYAYCESKIHYCICLLVNNSRHCRSFMHEHICEIDCNAYCLACSDLTGISPILIG